MSNLPMTQHKSWKLAYEIEDQLVNISIFNKQGAVILSEIPCEEFFREENREIRNVIAQLLAEQKIPSVTSIYNMLQENTKKFFMDVSTCQAFGDPFTLLSQFKSSHRLCNMSHKLGTLYDLSMKGDVNNFEDFFEDFIDKFACKENLEDATKMSEVMARPLLQQEKSYQFFDIPIKSLAELVPKIRTGQYICISGAPACITGDTIVRFHRTGRGFKKKISDAYNSLHHIGRMDPYWDKSKPTYVKSFNGKTIQLHEIETISYSGVRDVSEIILEDGHKITATNDHKIMTKRGWVEVRDLILGTDEVMIDSPNPTKSLTKKVRKKDKEVYGVIYHPYAIKKYDKRRDRTTNRISSHRLIYEAHINNLDYDDYIDCLKNYKSVCDKLIYVDPKIYNIHHKDGDHHNNDIDNLIQMTILDHRLLHSETDKFNFSQGFPRFSKIISREHKGMQDTYDIICKDPYRNFSANDIIVHNSGKTTLAGIMAEKIPKMLMISYEMDEEEIHDTIVSRNSGVDSRKIEFKNLSFEEKQKVDTQRRILKDSLTMFITDTPPKANDLSQYIRRMKHKHNINGVIIDYAQLIPMSGGKGTKTEQYEELSRKFKQIARELKIVVIALSSINGASLKEGRAPNLGDLRGSLSFGADADTVIFTYGVPSDEYGKEEPACAVAKQRKGRTGKVENFKYLKPIHTML